MKRLLVLWAVVGSFFVGAGCSSGKGGGGSGGTGEGGSANGGASGDNQGGAAAGRGGSGQSGGHGGAGTGGSVMTGGTGSGGASGGSAGMSAGGNAGTTGNMGGSPAASGGAAGGCMPDMTGIVRDFLSTAPVPDFNEDKAALRLIIPGIVKDALGIDHKPIYALNGPQKDANGIVEIHGKDTFDQWFNNVNGVNMPFEIKLPVTVTGIVANYGLADWRPIDGKGFGDIDYPNMTVTGDAGRNQLFTYELHTEFEYQGAANEIMTILSDDDSWVFVNNKLAIDAGGLHGADGGSFRFSESAAMFGLEVGKRYPVDIFMADRQLTVAGLVIKASNVKFTNCAPILFK